MADENLASLPLHYERHLGDIQRGWSDEKETHGVQIVSFERQPEPGVRTFATLGLGRHVVKQPRSGSIRQELLISVNEAFSSDAVAGLLLSLAERVLVRHEALLRGEVIGPAAPVVAGSKLTAIYVTNPSPFDKSLTEFASEPPPLVFAYLVPIAEAEAVLVREKGCRWFEEQLERQNPDIWNLARTETIQAPA